MLRVSQHSRYPSSRYRDSTVSSIFWNWVGIGTHLEMTSIWLSTGLFLHSGSKLLTALELCTMDYLLVYNLITLSYFDSVIISLVQQRINLLFICTYVLRLTRKWCTFCKTYLLLPHKSSCYAGIQTGVLEKVVCIILKDVNFVFVFDKVNP